MAPSSFRERLWTVVWGGDMAVGNRDQWGDYPLAVVFVIPIGVVIMAAGLAGMGRWLSSEEPVDLTPSEPLAIA
jgi:hypothetical protein